MLNYEIEVKYSFQKRVLGIFGEFKGEESFRATPENIEEMIKKCKKIILENGAMIDFNVIEWGEDYSIKHKLFSRVVNARYDLEYPIRYIYWGMAEKDLYNVVDEEKIKAKDIRKVILKFIERFNNYVEQKEK